MAKYKIDLSELGKFNFCPQCGRKGTVGFTHFSDAVMCECFQCGYGFSSLGEEEKMAELYIIKGGR